MKFNPSHQSYGSGFSQQDYAADFMKKFGDQSSVDHSREGPTPEEIGGSGPASILLQTPPPEPPPHRSATSRQKWGLLIGGIVLVIAWDPLKAIWRSK